MVPLWILNMFLTALFVLQTDEINAGSGEVRGNLVVHNAVQQAIKMVDRAYKESRDDHKVKLAKGALTSADLLAYFKQPMGETRTAVRSAEYMETALKLIQHNVKGFYKNRLNITDLLTQTDMDTISRITGCSAPSLPTVCGGDCWSNRYRTINSQCNNRKNPRLGAANGAFARWLPAQYEDGFSLPKGWNRRTLYSGFRLPLVRRVSNKILQVANQMIPLDQDYAHIFVQWGQWLDHDLDLAPQSGSIQTFNEGIHCDKTCARRSPCFPIRIPRNDYRFNSSVGCMPFLRSAPVCGIGDLGSSFGHFHNHVREQLNAVTAFIDSSMVYGSVRFVANRIRNHTTDLGMLMINQNYSDNGLEYLPFSSGELENPCTMNPNSTGVPCFMAGDGRVNEHLGLLSFHVLFLREHNRLARELKRLNPHWSGETTYQEARKIMGAFHQIITFRDYIPKLIGPAAMRKFLPPYVGYNYSIDPRIANVFATACFRYAHVTIQPLVHRFNENYQEHPQYPNIPLRSSFFSPWRIVHQGGIEPILRGLLANPAKRQKQNRMIVDELRQHLFELTNRLPLDLASLNLQRSRDHGLPGYNAWRRFCGLAEPKNVKDLTAILRNSRLARDLFKLYGTAENIEPWLGGVSEPSVRGGRLGPLLACLAGQQFKNLRDGDRFWWEHQGVFTIDQQKALKQVSLSRVICDNTRIEEVPRDAFRFRSYPKGYVSCTQISRVDLSAWKENVEVIPCGSVPIVAHAHFTICKSSIRYTCECGYMLVGADTIMCVSDGQWDPAPPGCTGSLTNEI
ncbi:eosinophil peroxidase-like [Amblyraja radiata]|uniref:eosinophil peroxidase-like n=1 Tax=Amblyraja radiata TaxID=386614 RepID=UPI001403F2C8|nr:eosinophil peroxidase-like [Amblyraja radiata]XP_032902012.1 eosinophil peroxidase-like [Amblyraja radiata]XP_032902013.1 eosinophil peroxidase-like [Amblyraja radiata]